MTLSQDRRETDAFIRRNDTRLVVYRLRPVANEYCGPWQELVDKEEPPPVPQRLFKKRLTKDSLRQKFPAVLEYLEGRRQGRRLPRFREILRRLILEYASSGLVPRGLSR